MALTKLTTDLNIIAALDDEPNDVGGLTAAQLKAEFDESGIVTKAYINETLTVELDDNFATKAEVQSVVLGQIPNGTITEAKLETTLATTINNAAQADDLVDTAINLSEATKTALGLTDTKYVSDALAKLSGAALRDTTSGNKLVDMSGTEFTLPYAQIATGSYTGTGTFGSSNPNTLSIPSNAKTISIINEYDASYLNKYGSNRLIDFPIKVLLSDYHPACCFFDNLTGYENNMKFSSNTLSWYGDDAKKQLNVNGKVYYYLITTS